jgi:hypothetical protein
MMTFFFMVVLADGSRIAYGTVFVREAADDDEAVGIVGTAAIDPTLPVMGATIAVGTAAAELTPRLSISVESSGIPARALVVADDVDVGVDGVAAALEPAPHIPDNPAVAAIPEVTDNPDVAAIAADIPDVALVLDVAVSSVDAAAGVVAPLSVTPPPS